MERIEEKMEEIEGWLKQIENKTNEYKGRWKEQKRI